MFSPVVKKNGDYFQTYKFDRLFGITGTISIETTEKLFKYENLVDNLNEIFTPNKMEEYIYNVYKSLKIFNITKVSKELKVIPIDSNYNKLSLCKLGQTLLGHRSFAYITTMS